MAKVIGVDHVQVAIPKGGEEQARQFYGDILGLQQIAKPAHLAVRGGLWFACGEAQLHIGAEEAFVAAKKAHPALLVDDLPAYLAMLDERGVAWRHDEAIAGAVRAATADPFGNKIELIQRIAGGAA